MSIEIKISKKRIPYKKAMLFLNKRVEEVKNGEIENYLDFRASNNLYSWVSFNKNEIIDKKIKLLKLIEVVKLHYIIQVKKLFILLLI